VFIEGIASRCKGSGSSEFCLNLVLGSVGRVSRGPVSLILTRKKETE
jgi:hypothetical protein